MFKNLFLFFFDLFVSFFVVLVLDFFFFIFFVRVVIICVFTFFVFVVVKFRIVIFNSVFNFVV